MARVRNKKIYVFLLVPFIGLFLAFQNFMVPNPSYCGSRFAYQCQIYEQPGEISELLSFYSLRKELY